MQRCLCFSPREAEQLRNEELLLFKREKAEAARQQGEELESERFAKKIEQVEVQYISHLLSDFM